MTASAWAWRVARVGDRGPLSQEPVLSFHHVGLEDRTRLARLRRRGLDSLSHLGGLRSAFSNGLYGKYGEHESWRGNFREKMAKI